MAIYPARVTISLPSVGGPWRFCGGYWLCIGAPVPPSDVRMQLARVIPPGFVVGIADTSCPRELATILCGTGAGQWGIVERGPELVQLDFFNCEL